VRGGRGWAAHADLLAASLADEGAAHEETRRFVASFLRPHGIERDCNPLFAEALERVATWPPLPRDGAAAVGAARVLALAALPVARALMARPKEGHQPLGRRLSNLRQETGKRLSRLRKVAAKRVRQFRKDVKVRVREFKAER
jgi:hypothetical protein